MNNYQEEILILLWNSNDLIGRYKKIDERVKEYWELLDSSFVGKREPDEGADNSQLNESNTMPSHPGAFVLSNSKRILNGFMRIDGLYPNNVYYEDTDD